MIVREMGRGDIDAAARIMAESELWQRYSVTEESAAKRLSAALDAGQLAFVGEENGQVAGFIRCDADSAFGRSGYVQLLGVDGARRSKGLGALLLSRAEDEVRAHGRGSMFLFVSDFNERAQRFYERQGYQRVGVVPDYVMIGITELLYFKKL